MGLGASGTGSSSSSSSSSSPRGGGAIGAGSVLVMVLGSSGGLEQSWRGGLEANSENRGQLEMAPHSSGGFKHTETRVASYPAALDLAATEISVTH